MEKTIPSANLVSFPKKNSSKVWIKKSLVLAIDQLTATNESWGFLFKHDNKPVKTRKIFRTNVSKVLKIMIFLCDPFSFKIGSDREDTEKFYYSHGAIMWEANLPKWTYYNVIKFLRKTRILFIEKTKPGYVNPKRLSYKLFEILNIIIISNEKNCIQGF